MQQKIYCICTAIGIAPRSRYIQGTIVCGGLRVVEAEATRPSVCPCCALDRMESLLELTVLA